MEIRRWRDTELWVTEDGQVWSERLRRFLKQYPHNFGYPTIQWNGPKLIHQLVCECFHGPKPTEKHEVRHVNDPTPTNVHYTNLCWGTRQENAADKRRHGSNMGGGFPGEKNGFAKYTDEQIKQIYRLFHIDKLTRKEIAEKLGLRYGLVVDVINGKCWSSTTKNCLLEEPTI